MKAGTFLASLVLVTAPTIVRAETAPIDLSAVVTVDFASVVAGDGDARLRALTNVDIMADVDLASLTGWTGAKAFFYMLDNRGGRPNDSAATLQGVNNIEVPNAGLRLFEAWVEQDLGGGASLRAGLYDLNSEFYANQAAGVLLAPSFGIGSELAATGSNGPSIFPSSALAVRLYLPVGSSGGFVRGALVNARAGTLGDSGGVDLSFPDGVLMIAEAGMAEGPLRGTVGAWHYSRNPVAIYEAGPDGDPLRKPAQGAYVVLEGDLVSGKERQLTAFLRAGLANPHTTPITGGFQTGLLLAPALSSRPDSQFSVGLQHAWTSNQFRDAFRPNGAAASTGETGFEITYADNVLSWLAIQPDLQWIHHPGGHRAASDSAVMTLRVTASF